MLDRLCEEFVSRARLDSSGVFTVDWSGLSKAYLSFSKALPDLYLCKIFQAAVCASPTRIDIDVAARQIEFRWPDGGHFDAEELASLHDYLQRGSAAPASRSCRHLASAILFLSTRPEVSVTVASGQSALVWERNQARLTPGQTEGTSIRIISKRWLPNRSLPQLIANFDLSSPRISLFWPEFTRFRRRLGFHPGHVCVNGIPAPCGRAGNLASHVYLSPQPERAIVGLDLSEIPPLLSFELNGEEVPGATPSAQLACRQYLNVNLNFGVSNPYTLQVDYGNDQLVIVSDGLAVYRSGTWLGKVGVVMVVGRSDLQTDASTLNLVQSPQLESAIAQARQDAEHYLFGLEDYLATLPPSSNPNSMENQLAAALRSLRSLPR